MSKTTKKRIKYNEDVLQILENRYGFTRNYILKSLRGDRVGIIPDKLIKEYKKLDAAAKQALKNKANQLD